MTVESAKNKAGPFEVSGTSGTFPRDFLILDDDHLRVIRVRGGEESDLTAGVGHTGIGTASGTVVVSTGIEAGDQIYLLRAVPNLQRSDYNAQGRVRTDQVENDLDLMEMQIQDLAEAQGRALTLPVASEIGGEAAMAAALAAPEYAAQAMQAAADAAAAAARIHAAFYDTREELAAALPGLPQGMTVFAAGQPYVVDSAATGLDSDLHDLGIDGARRESDLRNIYLSAFFTEQDDTSVHICTSLDGVHFSAINAGVLPIPGGGGLSIRDPAITWFNGEWWLFATGAAAGSHDFVVFKSRDLITWSKHQCTLGGGPYYSSTTPFPGGVVPCDSIWAPEPHVENGRLFVAISLRHGADGVGIWGASRHMKTFVSELIDPAALTWSVPAPVVFGVGYPENVRQWRQDLGQNAAPTTQLYHMTRTETFMGLDASLMEHLSRDYPNDTVLLVPAAKGGAGFSNSEWTAGGASRVEFAARLNAALAANPGATIEGMFWQQGEADRSNASYQTQLTQFLTYCRTTWAELASRPIIMGEMGGFVSAGVTDINAVIAAVAATQPNYGVASSVSLTDKGDALHFDANSLRTLGDRHYAAWRAKRGTLPGGSGKVRIFIIAGQSNAQGTATADNRYDANTSMIDMSVAKIGGSYYCAVKDDWVKRIRIYSANSLFGPWAFSQTLGDSNLSVEAPCIAPVYYKGLNSDSISLRWRVYVDNNRTGQTAPDPNVLLGRPYYYESSGGTPTSDFGAQQPARFDVPVRHGSVVNLGLLPPEAMQSLMQAVVGRRAQRPAMLGQTALANGTTVIWPQPDQTYYAGGTQDCDLIVRDGPADRFYLAVFSAQGVCGISVRGEAFVNRPFILGYGCGNDAVLEMRRRGQDGAYYPVGLVRRAEFRAHRNNATQSITAGSANAINWTAEAYDFGASFDPATERWTPPRGRVDIEAQVSITDSEASGSFKIDMLKNGVAVCTSYAQGAGHVSARVALNGDEASGTDYYEISVQPSGSGSRTVNGNTNATYFYGVVW